MRLSAATYQITLTSPDGTTLNLHVPPSKVVTEITGLGLSPRDIASTRSPFQQGSTVLSQRLTERTINLTLVYPGCSWDDYLSKRNTLIDFLRESRTALTDPDPYILTVRYVKSGTIYTRAINVYLNDGGALDPDPSTQWFQWGIQESFEFLAPDPIWYDPTQISSVMTVDSSPTFTWPTAFGVTRYIGSITYGGNWFTEPVIQIVGNTFGLGLFNFSTGRELRFSKATQLDNTVTLTVSKNGFTALDEHCHNLLNYVSGDISNFVLEPAPRVTTGLNTIYAYVEGTATITIKHYRRWRGILV
jgi:hypothetical protein